MPRHSLRTRSKKRLSVPLPGGGKTIHYRKEKPKKAKCSMCQRSLAGIPRSVPSQLGKYAESEKKVVRMFGGQLCSSCLQMLLKRAVRKMF